MSSGKTMKRLSSKGYLYQSNNLLSRWQIQLVCSCLVVVLTLNSSTALALAAASASTKKAVVVGGGPVGLASALTLSNPPHCYDVVVLEKDSVEQYDPTKAYLYNVNFRGQVWMKENFPSALQKLRERGSQGSLTRITIVPADPEKPIPGQTKPRIAADSKKQRNSFQTEEKAQNDSGDPNTRSYWIPRHSMICLLEDEIQEQEHRRKTLSNVRYQIQFGQVQVKKGRQFKDICCQKEDGSIEVTVRNEDGKTETYSGSLIVAADGYNSSVRECLADGSKQTWLHSKPGKFKVKKWKSPATGLRMKVIQMPPGFSIPDADGSRVQTESERTYAIRGINSGFRNYVNLGFLPVRDPSMIRPANVITRPNHEVWELEQGQSAKEWFKKAFPRLNWEEYVDDKEWERFAKAKGTSFPYCQYSPGLVVTSPDAASGVVLVGDACHAFPPDIGQGINAGLGDVVALDRALKGKDIVSGEDKKAPERLGDALQEYEREQEPQIRSLIRISRFGFPYQYKQALLRDRIGRFLLTSNITLRLLLSKMTFGLVQPSVIMLVQDPKLTYRQAMRRADMTTAGLTAVALALCWRMFGMAIRKLIGYA